MHKKKKIDWKGISQFIQLTLLWVFLFPQLSTQSALVVGGNFITQTNLQNLVSFWNNTWYEIEFLASGERNEINVVIETPKGLLVAGKLKGGPVSNIAIYDGTDWDSLNGGVEFEVIAASVDSTTNTIYVLCTSDNTDELPLFLWRPSNGWTKVETLLSSSDEPEMFFYQSCLYISGDMRYQINNTWTKCSNVTVWNTVTNDVDCLSFPADGFVVWQNQLLGYSNSKNFPFIANLSQDSWQPFEDQLNKTLFQSGVDTMASDGVSLLFAANKSHVFQYNSTINQWLLLPKQPKDWTYIEWLGILDNTLVGFGHIEGKRKIAFYKDDQWSGENQTNINEFRGWVNVLTITSKNYGSLTFRFPPIHPFIIVLIVIIVVGMVIATILFSIRYCKARRENFSIQEEESETFLTSKSL